MCAYRERHAATGRDAGRWQRDEHGSQRAHPPRWGPARYGNSERPAERDQRGGKRDTGRTRNTHLHRSDHDADGGGDPLLVLAQQFDGAGAYQHVRFLTSNELAGRKAGAPGADKAADYIAERFKAAGLKPAGDNGTYFQALTLPFIELAEAPVLMILNADGSVKRQFKHRLEFSEIIGGRAGDGQADGRLVFLGRGTAKDLALAGDIQGTVALIVPAPTTPRDLISSLSARGVLGIIEVGDAASLLIRYSYIPDNMIADGARPLVRASPDVAAELLAGSGATLQELEDRLTRDGAAFVSTPNRVKVSVKLLPVRDATTRNVLAMIPGTDPATPGQVVIVGGHYDHVGADPGGAVFQGANDNASGSAVVVGLAEYFAQKHIQLRYTLVFAAWTGEEAGLVGSMYYTQHPLFPTGEDERLHQSRRGRRGGRQRADHHERLAGARAGGADQRHGPRDSVRRLGGRRRQRPRVVPARGGAGHVFHMAAIRGYPRAWRHVRQDRRREADQDGTGDGAVAAAVISERAVIGKAK